MSKFEVFDGKQTTWEGLWWHPESGYFSSAAISLAQLRKFKGSVRLYVKKNRFYNNGENGRPNYNFILRDANTENDTELEVVSQPYVEDGVYYTEDGDRLYTHSEVQSAVYQAAEDGRNGYTDVLVSDYIY